MTRPLVLSRPLLGSDWISHCSLSILAKTNWSSNLKDRKSQSHSVASLTKGLHPDRLKHLSVWEALQLMPSALIQLGSSNSPSVDRASFEIGGNHLAFCSPLPHSKTAFAAKECDATGSGRGRGGFLEHDS